MGKKFTNTSYDLDGNSWTVDIYDTSFSGAVTNFNLVNNSLRINYAPDNQTRIAPILSSSCDFTMVIDNSTLLAFINGLAAGEEDKFRVQIKREGAVEWAGIILTDQITYLDSHYPFELAISATDGVKRLKDLEYYDDSGSDPVPYEGKETIVEHYNNIIAKIGTADLLNTNVLVTAVNWYEANHASTSVDPLAQTRFDHKTFLKYDSKTGDVEYEKTFEVLRTITENWGCRFMLSGGAFRVVQINEYESDSFQIFEYNSSSVQQATSTSNSFGVSLSDKIAGGTISFLPGLRQVEMEYVHRLSSNKIPDADLIAGHSVDFDNSGNVSVFFSCSLYTEFADDTFSESVYYEYSFEVKVVGESSTFYLRRNATFENQRPVYGPFEWSTTPANRVFFYSPRIDLNPIIDIDTTQDVSFIVEKPNTSGELTIQGQFSRVTDLDGTSIAVSPPLGQKIFNPYLEVADLSDRSNSKLFAAINDTSGYTAAISLSSLIGDGPSGNAFGNFETYDGSDWNVSDSWEVGGVSGTDEFHQLLVNEIQAGQVTPLRIRGSSYLGFIRIHECLVENSVNHIALRLTIDAFRGEVNGNFVAVATSISDVSPRTTKDFFVPIRNDPRDNNSDTVDNPITDRPIQREGQNTEDRVDIQLRIPPFTTDGGIDLGSTITSIDTTEATGDDLFLAGDKIKVVDRNTGETQTFTVATDVESGDTSIAINSATTTIDISDASYVALDPGDLHEKLNKRWYRQRFLNHSSATLTVTENGGNLPSDEAAIHVYAGPQKIFTYTVNGSDIELGFTPPGLDFTVEFYT